MGGWMDGWIVELLEYACKSYLIYARIRLHKNVFGMDVWASG